VRYFGKRGELRIQSGQGLTASSNHYFSVVFENMNFTGPVGRNRPEEVPVLDRGKLDTNTHYVQGSDEQVMAPIQISFAADLDDSVNRQDLRDVLGNPNRKSPWTVGGLSFIKSNGQSQIYNGSGSLVSTPVPFDTLQDRIDVIVLWTGATAGSTDEGWAYREVWFNPSQVTVTESDTAVTIAATGFCYGAISGITGFSAGSAV
jgi:hypothetical protein